MDATEVIGYDTVPEEDQPHAKTLLHLSFDTMVGIGTALIGLGLWFGFVWWRRRDIPQTPWFLRAVAGSGVATIVAMEAGWIVTEVGRQPWIVYEVMRVEDAVTGANSDAYTNAYTDTDANSYADANSDSNTDADAYTDADTYSNTYTYTDANTDPDSDADGRVDRKWWI